MSHPADQPVGRNQAVQSSNPAPSDAALANSLAGLWPHRSHESGALRNLLCSCTRHRWAQLDLSDLVPSDKQVDFCRWCSKIRIDGTVYGDLR